MRVYCKECGGKGRISSRNDISNEFVSLYCDCLECGHRWVSHLTFSHTLRPSEQMMDRLVFDRLSGMSMARRQELFQQLSLSEVR
ncbi:ogr/Delta-like zinc finger family protein [Pseudomonas sp. RAC1]|uniref:ogr/Delta-like zinc finger family protein n=1 Tax=Pseudomonas sp. RAC1 TaxID=3064900 RepID=UPI002717FB1D|nr:ogr/Delta-like zinc finger family protein [Pseudomonas sp. RAC1]MDV9030503.1 ogr/Delta-like zinc finger family protein [Pseudomonas sp. RAC1]